MNKIKQVMEAGVEELGYSLGYLIGDHVKDQDVDEHMTLIESHHHTLIDAVVESVEGAKFREIKSGLDELGRVRELSELIEIAGNKKYNQALDDIVKLLQESKE